MRRVRRWDDTERQLTQAREKLEESVRQLAAAKAQLEETGPKLESARQELEDGERELSDHEGELDDARQKLEDLKEPDTYVLGPGTPTWAMYASRATPTLWREFPVCSRCSSSCWRRWCASPP